MSDFIVDEWGNCWDRNDTKQSTPCLPHPELDPSDARCPDCTRYVYRTNTKDGFLWRCACGREFPGLHH